MPPESAMQSALTADQETVLFSSTGAADWWVGSPVRKIWKRGTASYWFEAIFVGSGQPFIRLETSSVTYRDSSEGPDSLSQSATPNNVEKLIQDRISEPWLHTMRWRQGVRCTNTRYGLAWELVHQSVPHFHPQFWLQPHCGWISAWRK